MTETLTDLAATELAAERVLILDFGSQVTQLIARRLRESGVYCEIWPFNADPARIAAFGARAFILSGGPASVTEAAAPRAPDMVFEAGVPVLGICYGQQLMCAQLGGEVQGSEHREFGRAFVEVTDDCALFHGAWEKGAREQVWMSHGDRVTRAAARLSHGGRQRGRAVRRHRRRRAEILRRAVPPRSRPHAARRAAPAQFHPQRRRPLRALDDGRRFAPPRSRASAPRSGAGG